MSKIAIVTDSTSGLSKADVQKMDNVFMIHFSVQMDGKFYHEGIDISDAQFYDELATSAEFPTTAPPSMQEMFDFYDNVAKQGFDTIISIHITSGITGFYNNLVTAVKDYEGPKVYPVDSFLSIQPMGYLVKYASELVKTDLEIDDKLSRIDDLKKTIGEYFVVDDLKNLVHGGRLTNAAAFTGGLLRIKPVLTMNNPEHKIVATNKIRTMRRAIHFIEDEFEDIRQKSGYKMHVYLTGTNNLESMKDWQKKIQTKYPELDVEIGQIGPVIGAHLGTNAYVLGWSKEVFDESGKIIL
ncbi:DegV family protein [Companilactobacillus mishanensis]|uniref:DegV family protein n=1 Tax=Companilactobacillus mishanensis TaxID=2486008 RepID=A0ABW9P6L0_9LACO|nr:DegV family protein [Companilactobacillus mishanensis]MQS44870.1 DegV family protein [Companilactobacillus mishanensis]MQS89385.1 DegV family protein [Companilactobacillus mishanensis]